MEARINSINFEKSLAHKSPADFFDIKGPFFVDTLYEWVLNEKGEKVRTEKVLNRFVRELTGKLNSDGTVPPESQGDTIAFVSTNWDRSKESEFVAFRDDDGALQWLLQNKTAGFTKESEFVFEG